MFRRLYITEYYGYIWIGRMDINVYYGYMWVRRIDIYIYKFGLSVCLFVCLYPINWSGPNFLWDITWPPGRFFLNPQNFFFFVLKCEQKEHVHNLKNNGREAPYKPIVDYIPIATNLNRILVSIIRWNYELTLAILTRASVVPVKYLGRLYHLQLHISSTVCRARTGGSPFILRTRKQ